ncbi:hypothetical protein JCM10295v2_006111 [Rhodotorula toruloides]
MHNPTQAAMRRGKHELRCLSPSPHRLPSSFWAENSPCESCEKRGLTCVFETYTPNHDKLVNASTSSPLAGPSSVANRLTGDELASSLGFELLTLYGDGGADGRSAALYPLPIFDYASIRSRFQQKGGRLAELSKEDQLLCRIIFASAAPHWRSTASAAPETRATLSRQLLTSAQECADVLGIWRKRGSTSTKSLLMLQQAIGGGDVTSDESLLCLSTCVVQITLLVASAAPIGPSAIIMDGGTGMIWNAGLFDAAISIERKKEPYFSAADYSLMFGYAGKLPSADLLADALSADTWSVTVCALFGLRAYLDVARKVATLLMRSKRMPCNLAEATDFDTCWRELDIVYKWACMAAQLALRGDKGDVFARSNIELYCNFACGPAIAAEFAMLQHLEDLASSSPALAYDLPDHRMPSLLDMARLRFPVELCQYLLAVRTTEGHNFVAIFAGRMISVSRILAIIRCFLTTSAWDSSLHAGPDDKLESLDYLATALDIIAQSYPEMPDLDAVREAVAAERLALRMIAGGLHAPSPSRIDVVSRPSLGRLNAWIFAHDVSQTKPLLLQKIVDALYDDTSPESGVHKRHDAVGYLRLQRYRAIDALYRGFGPTFSSGSSAPNPRPSTDGTFEYCFKTASTLTAEGGSGTVDTQAVFDLLGSAADPAFASSASPPVDILFIPASTVPYPTLDLADQPLFSFDLPPPSSAPDAQDSYVESTLMGAGNFDWFDGVNGFAASFIEEFCQLRKDYYGAW